MPEQIILILILILVVAAPVAWFASEFQGRRWLRLLLGCIAIAGSCGVAFAVGTFEHWNANAWYGAASQNLVDVTIQELEAGHTDKVVQELRALKDEFHPTYEHRARYDTLVKEYTARLGHDYDPVL